MDDHQQRPVSRGPDTSNDSFTAKPVAENIPVPVDMPVPLITWRSVVMGAFLSIGGFLFGYDTGQISGFQEMSDYLQRYGEYSPSSGSYYFSNVRTGLIVSLLSVGTLIGALVGAPVADRIGRKWSITSWCVVLIVGVIVQITSPNRHWWQQVVGRWVTGLGVGGCSLVVPMYQGESAPRHVRGALICCYQLFVTFGIFIAYVINLGTHHMNNTGQWRITLGLTMLFAMMLGGGMACFPESPRYDFRHGKPDVARRTMAKLYGVPENHFQIVQEMEEIREQMERETQEQKWHEFVTAPRMGYRVILGMVLQAFQQLTGANFFLYYGTSVFSGAGISDSFITQCILGAVNFGCTFGGLYVVENFGRRRSLIAGGIFMFCMFIIFASIGHFDFQFNNGPSKKPAGKGLIVVTAFFIAAYAVTWGPMIWAITAEIYPMKYRAKGMALATASNWLWNFLIGFFTPFIIKAIDFRYGYVFAGCLALMVIVTYFFVIETKDRTLEEIDFLYVSKVPPWKSSSYVIPPERFGAVLGEQAHGTEKEEGAMQHAEVA